MFVASAKLRPDVSHSRSQRAAHQLSPGSFFQGEQLPLPAKSLAEGTGMSLENVDHLRHCGFATPVALEFTDIRNHSNWLRAGLDHALNGPVMSFRCGTS